MLCWCRGCCAVRQRQARSKLTRIQHGTKMSVLQVAVMLPGTCPAELSPELTHASPRHAGEGESALLLAGARHAGLQAGLFAAMPHKGAARKYFLCMCKEGSSVAHPALEGEPPLQQQRSVCPLAWPVPGPLAVCWAASWLCQVWVLPSEHRMCMFCHVQ